MIASTSACDIGCAAPAVDVVAGAAAAGVAAAGCAAVGPPCRGAAPAVGVAAAECADPKMADAMLPNMLMVPPGLSPRPPPRSIPIEPYSARRSLMAPAEGHPFG